MKFKLLALPIIFIAFFSCSKEFSITQPVNGIFTAEINGAPWQASAQQVAVMNGTINIIGVSADGKSISIKLQGDTVGTYLSSQAYYAKDSVLNLLTYRCDSFPYTSMASDTIKYSTATIKITQIDKIYKTISGTFESRVFRRSDSTAKLISTGIFTGLPYSSTVAVDTSIIPIPKGDSTKTPVNPVNPTDTTSTINNPTGKNMFKAFIAGAAFISTTSSAMIISDSYFMITGAQGFNALRINVSLDASLGTHIMDDNGDSSDYSAFYTEIKSTGTAAVVTDYTSAGGTITITKKDETNKIIEGTFSFTLKSTTSLVTKQVTGGQFSVSYQ